MKIVTTTPMHPSHDFVAFAKYLALSKGVLPAMAAHADGNVSDRVGSIMKSAVAAGSTADLPTSGDYKILSGGFFELLRSQSVFFRLLGPGWNLAHAVQTRVIASSLAATGYIVGQGKPKPLTRLAMSGADLTPVCGAGIVVLSDEVLRATSSSWDSLLGRELRGAVTAVVDNEFLAVVLAGAASEVYGGSPPEIFSTYLKNMLTAVNGTAAGRLFWIGSVSVANLLSVATTETALVYSGMSPNGGTLLNTALPCHDQMTAGSLALIDASGIVGDVDRIELDASSAAALEFDDDPSNSSVDGSPPAPTAKNLVSLWQTNSTAILAKTYFAARRSAPVPSACSPTSREVAHGDEAE